ncbi:hypothetical protein [Rhodococcus gannanensis]|uniref:Secreted protein n=1 Tax=Rhodococcus gannanensis TaxID=1960308 RepID=A0ABW4P7G1_9NOCA
MSRSPMRRTAAAVAAGALVLGGATVSVGLGTGVASAQTACAQSSHAEKGPNLETWGVKHSYDRSVNVTEAASGSQVTYKTIVSTSGIGNPYVNTLVDTPPAGFGAPVSAKLTVFHAIGGLKTVDVPAIPDGNSFKFTHTGWFVNSGNPLTLETTYVVPSAAAGTAITSGGFKVAGTVGVDNNMPNLTACFTMRAPNPGEATLGSLDSAGLGSEEGQLSSTGSVSDILGDTIANVINSGAIEGLIS